MNTAKTYTREEIINALKNAPVLKFEQFVDVCFTERTIEFLPLGKSKVKGLWLLTNYGREYSYSFIADVKPNEDGTKNRELLNALSGLIPCSSMFSFTELFEEEESWFIGLGKILQEEVMMGNIRKVYSSGEYGDFLAGKENA